MMTFAPRPRRHLRRVHAHDATAEDHDLGRRHARDAAEQHAAAAVELLEVLRAFLDRHPARHFRHRDEEREVPVRELDRLVRDAGRARVHVRLGELLVGGEVEVGEDRLSLPHARPLDRDRLLHLDDHLGFLPDGVGRREDLRADARVLLVREARALTGALLDVDGMTSGHERLGAGRDERDTILVRLDLLRDSDLHVRAGIGEMESLRKQLARADATTPDPTVPQSARRPNRNLGTQPPPRQP
jgi:hypothetical protein